MKTIRQQIIEEKQNQIEKNKDLWFVDYCNNCKTDLASKYDTPCHHPYYCWHEGESAIVQDGIIQIEEYRRTHGFITTQMYEQLKVLHQKKRKLIGKGKARTIRGY